MNATAYFISDRAQSLVYEALKFPETAEMAIAWLGRAMDWAQSQKLTAIENTLNHHLLSIVANLRATNRTA